MTKSIRRIPLLILVLQFLIHTPQDASAAMVVSNVANIADGTYNIFDLDAGFGSRSGRDIANSFITGNTSLTLESVTLFMANSAVDNGGFSLALYSNSGAQPGADLGVIFSGVTNPGMSGNYTYTASTFTLTANTTYWLVASVNHAAPDKTYAWRTSSDMSQIGDSGWSIGTTVLRNVTNGVPAGWAPDTNNAQMFSVQAVPEPSAALLLLGSITGILLRRRHR